VFHVVEDEKIERIITEIRTVVVVIDKNSCDDEKMIWWKVSGEMPAE